jgi:catechol 2,3-dioxygenase-like lactoylglutathione lyase family enzyme
MLTNATVTANMPAADLDRARSFYADKLGLEPVSELAGEVLQYRTAGGSSFSVYRTDYAGTAGHTLAQWHVADVEQEVRDLQAKGVRFETYDMPGVRWEGAVAVMEGMGKAAWFTDSEGNILCIDQEEAATA